MNALTEQLDNRFLSNFLEGAKDISQNKNVFYTDPFEIYTGDYEGRRLDPSRKYEIDLNKDYVLLPDCIRRQTTHQTPPFLLTLWI